VNVFHNYEDVSSVLHSMHTCRMAIWLKNVRHLLPQNTSKPLKDISVLDLGCGDGLTTYTCLNWGAQVTAVDNSHDALRIAHQNPLSDRIQFHHQSIEEFLHTNTKKFTFIFCLEALEHIPKWQPLLPLMAQHLHPQGILSISTINRTWRSYMKAIVWTEYVAQWLPRHTHQWQNFIPPSEIIKSAQNAHMQTHNITGMRYLPFSKKWLQTTHADTNYLLFLKLSHVY